MLHLVFNLPVKQGFYVQLGADVLHILRSRYAYLKILLIDEIVMTGLFTFNRLNKALQVVKQSALSFCGMSLLGKDCFLQLPPVKQLHIFAGVNQGTSSFVWSPLGKST